MTTPYADYAYYSDIYGGISISQDAFAALARRASLFIDQITYNRLNTGWAVTDAVKNATCAVAEVLEQYKTSEAQEVTVAVFKSESVGGWSGTYQDTDIIRATIESAMENAARPYLIYTGLMDRSVFV
ncbi:head-tail connector protein [Caproiciproducens faecalis]|uniref:Uncharacterized protein n=1 Tax=Caproiciproducens faecalis TaxID=2820301 RepID=A0ABS7DRH6_9FIRM|nr:hypothetical protein [Caproiciproducens faecalis]MBW7573912.1 hypothetical protein [Caproiciproducens faecalis]